MTNDAVQPSKIWVRSSEIWPDFAESAHRAKSAIWIFRLHFKGLEGAIQILESPFQNLLHNLEFVRLFSVLEQISDFRKLPPKGVGGLPATGGESHHLPLGNFSGRSRTRSTTPIPDPKRRPPMPSPAPATAARAAVSVQSPAVREDRAVLALDLGTTTGWALRGSDGLITSGTASFRPGRFDGGGMRYLRFANWLAELDRLSGPLAAIWFEEVRRHAGTDASHIYGGLMATLTAWAERRGIPYEGVPVGTIKRHATGKGNAPKDAMIAAARARGFTPADDNEADAVALLLWAIETKGGIR